MTYKTILTYLDASTALEHRIDLAAHLCQQSDAHLVGLAPTGVATLIAGDYLSITTDFIGELQAQFDELAKGALDQFNKQCEQLAVKSFESRLVGNTSVETVLLHGRYSDLIVIGQADPDVSPSGASNGFVEQVLLASGRPVIVVPHIGISKPVGKRVLFAWDASREAARALTDSLPILQDAENVEVVVVNANDSKKSHGPVPGADIGLYLARHGVNVEIKNITSDIDVGNTLLSHAADFDADMLVMGAYGHSRIREWVMGGTTRTILQSMTIPVLMTH